MNFKKIKNKIIPNFIIITLLISSTLYFLIIFHFLRPDYNMVNLSYDEKMEQAYDDFMREEGDINMYELLIFINDTIEEDSVVLFFNTSYWQYSISFLYPRIKSLLLEYSNDEDLYEYLRFYHSDYILIAEAPNHLSLNTNVFTKIEFNKLHYLLEIHESEL